MKRYYHHIHGKDVPPASGEWLETFNPFTGKPWAEIPRGNEEDADRVVEAASRAFEEGEWATLTPSARGGFLHRLGDLIAQHAEALAQVEVTDNGKLLAEMEKQLKYLPQWYYYYGGLADKIEGAVIPIDKSDMLNFTRYEPLGVCLAITAWNSPLMLATWKIAPALAAGNTVVLKPSEHASASALEFAQLVKEAGFPPGVVNVVTGYGHEIGEALVNHPKVAKVAFTGGDAIGQKIYEKAASGLKHVTLELGGKSPNIILPDANVPNAVKGVISGIFAATGQSCIAGSRLLVPEKMHDAFVEELVTLAKTAKMGNPLEKETQVGPVATTPQLKKILGYLSTAKEEGAECVLGGKRADRPECGEGWFVEPSIYTKVHKEMRIFREEIFGPVLSVMTYQDEEEIVALANDTPYGLAAGIWTQDMRRALHLSSKIKAGTIWVNTYRVLSYLSPFGGYKRSGIGRENGKEMIYEYLQPKSIWINTAEEMPNPFVLRL